MGSGAPFRDLSYSYLWTVRMQRIVSSSIFNIFLILECFCQEFCQEYYCWNYCFFCFFNFPKPNLSYNLRNIIQVFWTFFRSLSVSFQTKFQKHNKCNIIDISDFYNFFSFSFSENFQLDFNFACFNFADSSPRFAYTLFSWLHTFCIIRKFALFCCVQFV